MTFLDGRDGLLARRVQEADQAKQDERRRQVGGTESTGFQTWILEPRQRQNALALGCKGVGSLCEMLPVQRHSVAGGGLLAIAVFDDDLGRTLDEQHFLAIRGPVQCRHELMLGFERDGIDARIRRLHRLAFQPELRCERVERSLGRVAFYFPRIPF
jgi:hypothetical protein